jgi:hypothetical protein
MNFAQPLAGERPFPLRAFMSRDNRFIPTFVFSVTLWFKFGFCWQADSKPVLEPVN